MSKKFTVQEGVSPYSRITEAVHDGITDSFTSTEFAPTRAIYVDGATITNFEFFFADGGSTVMTKLLSGEVYPFSIIKVKGTTDSDFETNLKLLY